jgi:hypothetical protein
MNWRLMCALVAGVPLLAACGGGSDNHGDNAQVRKVALCPASLDYGTTWTGGSGSGEVVKLQLDTAKMTWQLTFVESVVPFAKGTATPSRTGQVMSGTLTHETGLPTQNLNDCAFRLNGAYVTGTDGKGVDSFNDHAAQPARIFVGQGIMGGVLPGKEVQFDGISVGKYIPGGNLLVPNPLGVIADTTFRYFPFLAFASLDNSLTTLASQRTYTQLGFSLVMTQGFATNAIDAKWTINADGSYQKCDTTGQNAGKCTQTGTNFVLSPDGSGAFESANYQGQMAPYQLPSIAKVLYPNAGATAGKGFLLLGKVQGGVVPLLIRRGTVAIPSLFGGTGNALNVDDEVGISLLAPQTAIAQGSVDGEYILVDNTLNATAQSPGGNDDQFNYRALLMTGKEATLLDPFNVSDAATAMALNIGYTGPTPGKLPVSQGLTQGPATGALIVTRGAVAYLDTTNAKAPYFAAGAFVQ